MLLPGSTASGAFYAKYDLSTLADRVAAGRSIVVVGAGASVSAGLPTWHTLLEKALYFAQKSNKNVAQAAARLASGDQLLAAELLQRALGKDFYNFIDQLLKSTALQPSTIHQAIARLPFRAALTTNFDSLLEAAYANPIKLTWRAAESVFEDTHRGVFFILKIHGDINERETLVLTRTQFRDRVVKPEHGNARDIDLYGEALQHMLLTNTILFVGHSLRDSDLLYMMDNLVQRFGKASFGPHWAILCENEIDSVFEDFLKDSYNIHVLPFPEHEDRSLKPSDSMTRSVTRLLTELSGQVAVGKAANALTFNLDAQYYLTKACQNILTQATAILGTTHGAICLTPQRNVRRLQYMALSGQGTRKNLLLKDVPYGSEAGQLFLERRPPTDWQIGDLPDDYKGGDHYSPSTKSRLACPIYCDGHRDGIISVESVLPAAFTDRHVKALSDIAAWVGLALSEVRQRLLTADLFKPYLQTIQPFLRLLTTSRLLKDADLKVVLFKLRYVDGQMEAITQEKRSGSAVGPFVLPFEGEPSLAAMVLKERTPRVVRDVAEDQKNVQPILSPAGVKEFGVGGTVVGVPVRTGGYTAAVLLAWSGHPRGRDPDKDKVWEYVPERLYRISSLIANDPWLRNRDSTVTAQRFIEGVNKYLEAVDGGDLKKWTPKVLAGQWRETTLALLTALCDFAEVKRVRLWMQTREAGTSSRRPVFVCIASLNRVGDQIQRDEFLGIASFDDDPYIQYTLRRFGHDPYARTQHKSMFNGHGDPNAQLLKKAPDGFWTVGPIVSVNSLMPNRAESVKRKLMGFLATDNHVFEDGKPVDSSASMSQTLRDFQRCTVDVVTEILAIALSCNRTPPVEFETKVHSSPVLIADRWGIGSSRIRAVAKAV